MKISEVIHRLEEIKAERGDLHVVGVTMAALGQATELMPRAIDRVQHYPINEGYALIIFQPGRFI